MAEVDIGKELTGYHGQVGIVVVEACSRGQHRQAAARECREVDHQVIPDALRFVDSPKPGNVPDLEGNWHSVAGFVPGDFAQAFADHAVGENMEAQDSWRARCLDASSQRPKWSALLGIAREPTVTRVFEEAQQPVETLIAGLGESNRRWSFLSSIAHGHEEVQRRVRVVIRVAVKFEAPSPLPGQTFGTCLDVRHLIGVAQPLGHFPYEGFPQSH